MATAVNTHIGAKWLYSDTRNYPTATEMMARYPRKWAMATYLLNDICVLYWLSLVSPVCDANMFTIYGSETGYDVNSFDHNQKITLATKLKKPISMYVDRKLKDKLSEIVVCWWNTVTGERPIIFELPEPQYKQFMGIYNLSEKVLTRRGNINNEPVISLIQSINNTFIHYASSSHVTGEAMVPVDPAKMSSLFSKIIDVNNESFLSDDYTTQNAPINRQLIMFATCILKLILTGVTLIDNWTIYDHPDIIYDKVFASSFTHEKETDKVLFRKSRTLQPCHVVCLGPQWIDGLEISAKPIVRDNTSSMLMRCIFHMYDEDRKKNLERYRTEQTLEAVKPV